MCGFFVNSEVLLISSIHIFCPAETQNRKKSMDYADT